MEGFPASSSRHVEGKDIPVDEIPVDNGFAGFRVVVFVQGTGLAQVVAQQLHDVAAKHFRLASVTVVKQAAENGVLYNNPDAAQPVGGVVSRLQIIHFFVIGKGADTGWTPEGLRVESAC